MENPRDIFFIVPFGCCKCVTASLNKLRYNIWTFWAEIFKMNLLLNG